MPLDSSSAITINGITCWELCPNQEMESMRRTEVSRARRRILCKWNDRIALYFYMFGGTYSSNGKLFYYPPQAYPDIAWCIVDSIDMTPVAGIDPVTNQPQGWVQGVMGALAGKYAMLDISYSTPNYDLLINPGLATVTLEYASQVQSWPSMSGKTGLKWKSNGNAVDERGTPPLHWSIITITITVNNQAPGPPSFLESLADTVNSTPFLGWAAGQVKFAGVFTTVRANNFGGSSLPAFGAAGPAVATIPFVGDQCWKFVARSFPWNKWINPDLGTNSATTKFINRSSPGVNDYLDTYQTATTPPVDIEIYDSTPDYNTLFVMDPYVNNFPSNLP